MSHYDIEIMHGIIAVVVVAIVLIIVAIRLFIKAHKQYDPVSTIEFWTGIFVIVFDIGATLLMLSFILGHY